YKEWGSDIHERYGEEIAAVLRVPRELRLRWGLYKNLLGGVTSVVHHGARMEIPKGLITVLQDAKSVHSLSGEKGWRRKLLFPFRQAWPLVIHIGEGTTPACSKEIDVLLGWNIFKRPLIGVHGIAMSPSQAAGFRALVWCPDSNYFLYGKTADVPLLRDQTRLVFGTDSTLTSSWDIWQQLRSARELDMVEDRTLWDMVTAEPARLWGLEDRGTIAGGCAADLVIAGRPRGSSGWDAVFGLAPGQILLVLHQGNIRLFDGCLLEQLRTFAYPVENFYPVVLAGKVKYVQGDLPGLMREIRRYHPDVLFPVTAL
ncbi:MAG TPA: amidohydrolase family protein, partial [Puia sp.]|nr:amidohydrolase family protein [Puia sp.]